MDKVNIRHNIFLDFLNPDYRKSWGFGTKNTTLLGGLLKELLNLSILLTQKKCYVPPVFLLEDILTQKILNNAKKFIDEGYILFPMKITESLDETVDKVLRTYRYVTNNYSLFSDQINLQKSIELLESSYLSRVEKNFNTSNLLAQRFQEGLDLQKPNWLSISAKYNLDTFNSLQKIPTELYKSEIAITYGSISKWLNRPAVSVHEINKLLNSEYHDLYKIAYNCATINNLFYESSFGPVTNSSNNAYDFQNYKRVFTSLKIIDFVKQSDAPQILQLRQTSSEFHEFMNRYFWMTNNARDIESYMASVITQNSALKRHLLLGESTNLQYIVETLGLFNQTQVEEIQKKNFQKMATQPIEIKIAIFAALKEEEDVLQQVLGLKFNQKKGLFHGKKGNVTFELYSPRQLGRVAAAIETYKYLQSCDGIFPNLLVVAGIAGGFEKRKVSRGDVIVPNFVLDVSNTKREARNSENKPNELIRFHPFQLDLSLAKYLESPNFDEDKWKINAAKNSMRGTFDNGYSKLVYKPISCCDSVIKDEEWIDNVLAVNPELVGIEMESGGVCYAANKFNNIPVSVLRGISDLANPYKADDSWRHVAIRSVAELIKSTNFKVVLGK